MFMPAHSHKIMMLACVGALALARVPFSSRRHVTLLPVWLVVSVSIDAGAYTNFEFPLHMKSIRWCVCAASMRPRLKFVP